MKHSEGVRYTKYPDITEMLRVSVYSMIVLFTESVEISVTM